MSDDLDEVLLEGLTAIEPYLDVVVLAGGWVPYLYKKSYEYGSDKEPLFTRDIDIALPQRGLIEDTISLGQMLREAGFDCDFRSHGNPPAISYVKELESETIEMEFITHAPGSSEEVVKKSSVSAQSLHYVSLLFDAPWTIVLQGFGSYGDLKVRVPRPASYLFHKALTTRKRHKGTKVEKDLYYMFYVLDAFPEWKDDALAGIWEYAQTKTSWSATARNYLTAKFSGGIDSSGVDALVSQRPQGEFPNMDENQFRQYANATMSQLIDAMVDKTGKIQKRP